jgi:hypothetical protein
MEPDKGFMEVYIKDNNDDSDGSNDGSGTRKWTKESVTTMSKSKFLFLRKKRGQDTLEAKLGRRH